MVVAANELLKWHSPQQLIGGHVRTRSSVLASEREFAGPAEANADPELRNSIKLDIKDH